MKVQSSWEEGRLYRLCDWIMKLAYVNILWFLFTLIGMIVTGIAPASISLFTVIRKWLIGEENIPIFKTFFYTYKKEFLRANAMGLLMIATACILYIDFLYMLNVRGMLQVIFSIFLFMATIFYMIIFVYVFPIYVHYKLRFFQYIKYSFLIGMVNPVITIKMIVSIILLVLLFMHIPGLVPFFGISLYSFILMWGGLQCFRKIEEKQRLRLVGNIQ